MCELLVDKSGYKDRMEGDFLFTYEIYIERLRLEKIFSMIHCLEIEDENVSMISIAERIIYDIFSGQPSVVIIIRNEVTFSLVIKRCDKDKTFIVMLAQSRESIVELIKKYKIDKRNVGVLFSPRKGSYDFLC